MRSLLSRCILTCLAAVALAGCATSGDAPVDRPDRPNTTTWHQGY